MKDITLNYSITEHNNSKEMTRRRGSMRDTWSLDVMYQGFEDKKFKADLDELDIRIQKLNQFAENLTGNRKRRRLKKD